MSAPSESQAPVAEAPARKPDPLAELEAVIGTIRQSSYRYLAASIDSVRARFRQALIRALLALAAVMLLFFTAAVGAVLVLIGASQAVAAALNLPLWSGLLIVGAAAILLTVIVIRSGIAFTEKRSLERARERIQQRAETSGDSL